MVKFFTSGLIYLLSLQLLWAQKPPQASLPAYQEDVVVFKLKEEGTSAKGARTLSGAEPARVAKEIAQTLGAKRAVSVIPQNVPAKMQTNSRTGKAHPLASLYKLELESGQDVAEVICELQKNQQVVYAEPYFLPELLHEPDDEFSLEGGAQRQQLELIKAFQAWDISQGSRDVLVGILDTGIDFDHPDLMHNLYLNESDPMDGIDNDGDGYIDNYRGWDFANNDNNPTADQNGHGTLVAGFSSASTNNEIGISGTGYQCRYMPIKVFRSEDGIFGNGYEAILYAAEMGCDVINLSWGAEGIPSQFVQDIINYVVLEKDVVIVAAAGNISREVNYFPASYQHVLSVSASDFTDAKANYASWSRFVDLLAPGKDVFTTKNGGKYGTSTGTSFSSPMVAGAAALIRSHYPELNARQVMQLLRQSAEDVSQTGHNGDFTERIGKGRLNMEKALAGPTSPAVEMQQFELFNGFGPFAFKGDTVEIRMDFINLLSPTSELEVQLSSSSPHVSFLNNTINLGALNTLGTARNDEQPFRLILSEELPDNEVLSFRLGYADNDYSDYQYFEIQSSGGFFDFKTNALSLTVSSNGNLAYHFDYKLQGTGFRYKNHSLAHNMGLIIAQSPQAVASNAAERISYPLRSKDFESVSRLRLYNNSGAAYDARTAFQTTPSQEVPLDLLIEQKILGWEDMGNVAALVLEYRLTNKSDTAYEQLQTGMFVDFDLEEIYKNSAAWDGTHLLGYAWDEKENRYAGISLLSDYTPNYHALDIGSRNGNVAELTDSLSRARKHHYLSNGIGKKTAGAMGAGNDVAQLLGGTIPVLAPKESEKIAFALLTAPSLAGLQQAVVQARKHYKEYTANPPLLASLLSCSGNKLEVQPPEGKEFAFFSDPEGKNLLKTGQSFLFEELSKDTAIYVARADQAWLGDIGKILIEVLEPVALFEMSTDTLAINAGERGMLQLSDLSEQPAEWLWDFGNGYQSRNQSPRAYFSDPGEYTISLNMKNAAGCTSTYQQNLVVVLKQEPPVLADQQLCGTGSAVLKQENDKPFTLYADQQKTQKLFEGTAYETAHLSQSTTFYASNGKGAYESELSPVRIDVFQTGFELSYVIDSTATSTYALLLMAAPEKPESVIGIEWYINGRLEGNEETLSWPYQADEHSIDVQALVYYTNGCQSDKEITISLQQSPAADISMIKACKGDKVRLRPAADGVYYFYADEQKNQLIKKGRELVLDALQLSQDVYISNVSLGHESALRVATIELPDGLADFSASGNAVYLNKLEGLLFHSLHSEAISWEWDFGDGKSSTLQSPGHHYDSPGTYTVSLTVVSSSGCHDTISKAITVSEITGFDNQQAGLRLRISPNPVKDYLLLELPSFSQQAMLQVKDISGRLISWYALTAGQQSLQLEAQAYAAGWYIISLQTDEQLYSGRFIKE